MASKRRSSDAGRRVVLLGDLDRFDTTRALFPRDRERGALRDAVRAAVAGSLTPRQREIVEAHYFEGLSQCAIARRMGVAQQVVQKALFGDVRRGRRVGGALARLEKALRPVVLRSTPPTSPRAAGPTHDHGH